MNFFFGWKTTRTIFIIVKSLIGLGLVIFNLKEMLRTKMNKKDIIFLVVCLFLFGFIGYYDHIKELLF